MLIHEDLFAQAFQQAGIGMALVSPAGSFMKVNAAFCKLLGYSERALLSTDFQSLTHPEDLQLDLGQLERTLKGEIEHYNIEKRYICKDGGFIWCQLSVSAVIEGGKVQFFISQIQDISERKRIAVRQEQQSQFRQALLALSDAALQTGLASPFYQELMAVAVSVIPGTQAGSLLLYDPDDDVYRFAAAEGFDLALLKTTYLYKHELVRGSARPEALIFHEIDNSALPEARRRPLELTGKDIAVNLSVPLLLGERFIGLLNLNNFEDRDAFNQDAIEMASLFAKQLASLWQRLELEADIRAQKEAYKHQAFHDRLTGLPNRALFEDRLSQALEQARRRQSVVALLFVDLDDFKQVNDLYGHKTGDLFLKVTAERLLSGLRSSDTVARWGGDEFVILLTDLKALADVEIVCKRLLELFAQPFKVEEQKLKANMSMGAALYPNDAEDASALLHRADEALYAVKGSGKNDYQIYNDALEPVL